MSKKDETVFKERIRPHLEALPNTAVFKIQQVVVRGTPDFLLCIRGNFVALELKKDEQQKPDKLQIWNLERIVKAGGVSLVVYPENWDEIHGFLKFLATSARDSTFPTQTAVFSALLTERRLLASALE